jgi:hypothetical protein
LLPWDSFPLESLFHISFILFNIEEVIAVDSPVSEKVAMKDNYLVFQSRPAPGYIPIIKTYERVGTTWNYRSTLTSLANSGEFYGYSISLNDNYIMSVGDEWDSTAANRGGAAHMYTNTSPSGTWSKILSLYGNDNEDYSYFGFESCINNNGIWAILSNGASNENLRIYKVI